LNQISAVLDAQTEKLITQAKQLLKNQESLRTTNEELLKYRLQPSGSWENLQAQRYLQAIDTINVVTAAQKKSMPKYYDRQRMMDFYQSLRTGDNDGQAKSRAQAVKQAPPLDPNKLRYYC
jgi:hypothetical protein